MATERSIIPVQVTQFLRLLEADLSVGVGARLDSLLAQCMYFGLSFSRIGADFRGLLVPLFEAAVLGTYQRALHDANVKYVCFYSDFDLLIFCSRDSFIAFIYVSERQQLEI